MLRLLAGLGLLLGLVACDSAIRLTEAPTVFANAMTFPEEEIPERLQSIDPTIFYVTDRAPVMSRDGSVTGYSYQRSDSMAFGETWVQFGQGLDWSDLVAASHGDRRGRLPALTLKGISEEVRFPATPLPFERRDGALRTLETAEAAYRADIRAFQAAMATALAEKPVKEVLVYIHGFNTEFQDSLAVVANVWHFTGRRGVPITYSWPSGNPGLFSYLKDRESGEFAIFHLKEFLRALAGVPGLEKIHIIAHSRGTDVATSAVREMILVERGAGRNPRRSLKLGALIMAAPDLDIGIVRQRLIAERLAGAFDQITVYVNPSDGALGLAQSIATGTRFGRLRPSDLSPEVRASLDRAGNVFFVSVEDSGPSPGHAYFRRNPAVVSDIVLTLRTGAAPGDVDRPLDRVSGNFWTIHRGYPEPRPPENQQKG